MRLFSHPAHEWKLKTDSQKETGKTERKEIASLRFLSTDRRKDRLRRRKEPKLSINRSTKEEEGEREGEIHPLINRREHKLKFLSPSSKRVQHGSAGLLHPSRLNIK